MRDAAGPFDNKMMFGVINGLKKQKWFADVHSDQGTRYIPLEKFGGHRQYLERLEGDLGRMRELIRIFKTAKTLSCEITSTLYAAWNDLLLDGKEPGDAEIIEQASSATLLRAVLLGAVWVGATNGGCRAMILVNGPSGCDQMHQTRSYVARLSVSELNLATGCTWRYKDAAKSRSQF